MKCVQANNNCHEPEEETHYKYYQTLMVVALYLACCLATHKHVDINSWLSAVAEQGVRGWCIVSMNTQSRVQLLAVRQTTHKQLCLHLIVLLVSTFQAEDKMPAPDHKVLLQREACDF